MKKMLPLLISIALVVISAGGLIVLSPDLGITAPPPPPPPPPLGIGDGNLLKRSVEETCHACHKTDQNAPADPNAIKSHNSANLGSTKWGGNWGTSAVGSKYGAIVCTTCHTAHDTKNIYLIKETITTPDGSNFQGRGTNSVAVDFRVTTTGTPANPGPQTAGIMGDDSATHTTSAFICEVCHTYDGTKASGVDKHAYTMSSTNAHYNAQGCNSCHNHKGGFKASCDACHGNPPTTATIGGTSGLATPATGATNPLSPGAHAKHVTTRLMTCNACHTGNTMPTVSNTIQMGFVADSTTYPGWGPTAASTASFNGYNSLNAPYTFVSSNLGTTVTTSASYANTCSNLYCHGSALTAGTNTAPSWVGGAAEAACGTCHGATAATPPTAVSHPKHAGSAAGSYSFACTTCHPSVTDGSHVNGNVAWNLSSADSSATYRTTNSGSTGGLAPSAPYGSCATLYCHSKGTTFTSPYTGADPNTAPTWGGSLAVNCGGCHDGLPGGPSYANGVPKANSHVKHTASYTCQICHNDTTTTGNTITTPANHDNKAYNIQAGGTATFTPTIGNPTTATACSTISCHGGNNATWGGSVSCADCHMGTGEVKSYSYGDGTTARIDSTEWGYSGHGKAAGTYDVTLNPAANLPGAAGTGSPCLYCHDDTVGHGDGTNVFRLRNFSHVTWGKNGACMICHATGSPGVTGVTGIGNKNATKKIDKYHAGGQHSASLNGGQFCWDCHTGHGNRTAGGGPIAMIRNNPWQTSNATTGAPTTQTATAVVFTAHSAAGDFANNTTGNGVCQVCHTYKAADPNKMVHWYNTTPFTSDSHNSTTVCTQCHKHSADTTYDNFAFKGGGCNGCHDYDTRVGTSWGTGYTAQAVEGFGAHAKHIDHIKARFAVTLNPNTDSFGAGAAAQVCGTCHTNNGTTNHTTGGGGSRLINFGDATYKEGGSTGFSFLFDPAAPTTNPPLYNGSSGVSSGTTPKTCSAVGCHFATTPVWSAY